MILNLLIGTYSQAILFGTGELFQGKGKGIYLCRFDGRNVSVLGLLELENPSYLAIDEQKRKIYAVNEQKEFHGAYGGGITQVDYSCDGTMRVVASYPTGGTDPCHVAISPDGRFVGVANFADGSVTVFRLNEAGDVVPPADHFCHRGSSVHPVRQRGPHAHSVLFADNGKMFVPDLGIDRLLCYNWCGDEVRPDDQYSVDVSRGSGPRFGEFSPDQKNFYLINELASSITRFDWDGERMKMRDTISTLPEDFQGDNICSDLHITRDGRFLYASNRGHDSITSFAIGQDGALRKIECTPCRGKTPRNFAIDPTGRYLLVGNQDSDSIVTYGIGDDGKLTYIAQTPFPTPVCIRFFSGTNL